jgi:phenylalanyl-tRNA synthetase alpha chain
MEYAHDDVRHVAETLLARIDELENPKDILKAKEIGDLYGKIRTLNDQQKATFGAEVNSLKQALQKEVEARIETTNDVQAIDVTAPMDVNSTVPNYLSQTKGSEHPITKEIALITDIFAGMGFVSEESRELDDQYHMFEALNFPKGHPARDDYDTFTTAQTDNEGDGFIAPAHTSTMQNRVLKKYQANLERGEAIAAIVPDRVFRNEDLDARHEHTFYQIEGVYVAKDVTAGMLVATLQEFLQAYYQKELEVRINPYYFPFTEPSFEFALSCPFCEKAGCKVCGHEGWIELLGCGLIHPNVLRAADIDPTVYTGFAFGCGIDRLVMMKYGIEDIRLFHSARLEFLRQFA